MLQETEKKMPKEHGNKCLSEGQLNFARVAIACVDYIKMPLIDILHSYIEPKNLWNEVKNCEYLILTLNFKQKIKCGWKSSHPPDYGGFDVTLLSTLIQNCTKLPSEKPELLNEIKKIRELKNDYLSHIKAANLTKSEFDAIWTSVTGTIERIQKMMESMKLHSDCLKELDNLKDKTVESNQYEIYIKKLEGKFALHYKMHYLNS